MIFPEGEIHWRRTTKVAGVLGEKHRRWRISVPQLLYALQPMLEHLVADDRTAIAVRLRTSRCCTLKGRSRGPWTGTTTCTRAASRRSPSASSACTCTVKSRILQLEQKKQLSSSSPPMYSIMAQPEWLMARWRKKEKRLAWLRLRELDKSPEEISRGEGERRKKQSG